jgi:hypothetical protein
MKIAALCITHNRPKWIPWLYSQLRAQHLSVKADFKAFLVDSSDVPAPSDELVEVVTSTYEAISPKRNRALKLAQEWGADYFAWFDDDDWSNPARILEGVTMLEKSTTLWAVGNVRSWMLDARSLKARPYHTPEPLIFNSAVYRMGRPPSFREDLQTGEDTAWNWAYLGDRCYMVTSIPMGAWLCHGHNITNRANTHVFEDPFPGKLSTHRSTFEQNPECVK